MSDDASRFLAATSARLRTELRRAGATLSRRGRVAAYVFAACEYLREAYYDAAMDGGDGERTVPPTDALTDLARLGAAGAYRAMIAWLQGYDGAVLEWRDARWMPAEVELSPHVRDGKVVALHGTVRCWFRGARAWAALREHRLGAQGLTDANHDPRRVAEMLHRLSFVWQRDRRCIRQVASEPTLQPLIEAAGECFADGRLRVALCPLSPALGLRFAVQPGGEFFTIRRSGGVLDRPALHRYLDDLLADAARFDVHIVVLPELCIDGESRRYLATRLAESGRARPFAIVAGSHHFWRGGAARPINETVVLGPGGASEWTHRKRGQFQLQAHRVRAAAKAGLFDPLDDPRGLAAWVKESIVGGRDLEVCETSLGSMAVIICADAIRAEGAWPLVERLRPDLLFIVSMSPRSEAFLEHAIERLLRVRISTLYVNAHLVVPRSGILAFATLALPEGPQTVPTRIRWRRGRRPEWFDLAKGRWRELTQVGPRPAGAFLLPRGRGLVIDLGRHKGLSPPDLV